MNPKSWKQVEGPPLTCPEFFNGMLVKTDTDLTESEFIVDKPSRFIEYEPKDYSWLIYFNMGRWTQVPSKNCYAIDAGGGRKTIVMHPDTWEAVKKELKRQEEKRREMFFETLDPTKPKDFVQ